MIPSYPTPEEAVRALATAERYSAWRRRDPGRRVEVPDLDLAAAHRIVSTALVAAGPQAAAAGLALDPEATERLLATFGIDVWARRPVHDEASALAASAELGYPVVLKATTPHLRHRVDLGGVRLNIDGDAELLDDLRQMTALVGPLTGDNVVVQRMAPPGVACVVTSVEDPLFGPVVSFGLGGDASELLGDVAHRIPPLTDVDVADLVRSIRAAPRLFGHRGAAPADVPALEDLLGRVSCLADELPEVASLELNPVVVSASGLAVLSAEVVLARPAGRSDAVRRELPHPVP